MSFNLIIIVFVVACFSFIVLQCYEFVQNYNYILNFNKKYSKYEFSASPSYNYVDKSYYDPNDSTIDIEKKWYCKINAGKWYGVSPAYGLILNNGVYGNWTTEMDCINFIFSNFYLNYNNPCGISNSDKFCTIFNELK